MKKLPKTKKLLRQSFTCTDAEWKAIKDFARSRDMSVSKFVRSLILEAITPRQ